LILTGERSGLLTRIATTESVSLWRADEKLTAFVELESAIRAVVKQKLQSFSQNVWSDVAMEFAKHKNGHHPHF
jgi:hypothetical protein